MAPPSVDILSIVPQRFYRIDDESQDERLLLLTNVLRVVQSQERIKDTEDILTLLEALAARVQDPSIDCAMLACDMLVALTTRIEHNRFARYRGAVMPSLLQAFARADGRLSAQLADTLDAVFATTTVSALTEGLTQALQSRNPRVANGTLEFVQRCVAATPFAPVDIFSRMLAHSLVQAVKSGVNDDVRAHAVTSLGSLLRVVGLNPLVETLRMLDQAQYTAVHDAARRVRVKCPTKEDIPNKLPDPPKPDAANPKSQFGMSFFHTGPSWSGFEKIRHHFVFGDSLSSVGYRASPAYPQPSIAEPLGVPYPGETYNEGENWIGSLVRELRSADALAYVYARGGDTVTSLMAQVRNEFLRHTTALEPADGTLWTGADSIFWTFIGTNDCGTRGLFNVSKSMETLFELQEELYHAGARTFIFMTIMPVDRAPVGRMMVENLAERVQAWNRGLVDAVKRFRKRHEPECTVMLYDAHALFTRLIENPARHGMANAGLGGGLWVDDVHPTTHVQRLLAKDIRAFLDTVVPYSTQNGTASPEEVAAPSQS